MNVQPLWSFDTSIEESVAFDIVLFYGRRRGRGRRGVGLQAA